MKKKTVVITGVNGFLGRNFCEKLPADRFRIFPSIERLPSFGFIELIREAKPNYVIHCAGAASVPNSFREPNVDFMNSTAICSFVLDSISKYSPESKLIFLSSAAVYGNPAVLPIQESSTRFPISPYGYHKYYCEQLLEQYAKIHGVQYQCMRIFSAYGEYLKKQVIYEIFKRIADPRNEVIELYGDGTETRDFIHVADVVQAALVLMECEANGFFNVASGSEMSIRDLTERIMDITKSRRKIRFKQEVRTGDPTKWRADIQLLSSKGFRARVDLEEGLKSYWSWLQCEGR